jgi:hypothetical protein
MKLRLMLMFLLLIALVACGSPQPAAPTSAPIATTAPAAPPTSVPPTQPPPAAIPPTNTVAPVATKSAPTALPTPTDTLAPQPTDTVPAATKLRPTPTSAGPLAAAIYVANCRSAPTADKPGRIIVQISVEASGGNGRYRYFYQDKESPTKFIEVVGEKGTRLIGEVKVASGDGQEIKKEFDVAAGQLTCP